jgi:P-type Cu+ transporter
VHALATMGSCAVAGLLLPKMADPNPTTIPARDPVCGMNVNPANAKYTYEHAEKNYYFCCAACVEKFRANPEKYLSAPVSSGLVALGMPGAKPVPSGHSHEVPIQPDPKVGSQKPEAGSRKPESRGLRSEVIYVCPMCPEVRETRPVPCPSCGMALEPETPVAPRTEYTCPMHPEIVRPEPGSCPICGMALEPRTVAAQREDNPELRNMTRRFWISVVFTVPLLAIAMGSMIWPQFLAG